MHKRRGWILAAIIFVFTAASVWTVLRIRHSQNSPLSDDSAAAAMMEGKAPRDVTKWIIDNQGCADCHGFTQTGAFGVNRKGQDLMGDFSGCPAMMEAVEETFAIPEAQWEERHKQVRQDFALFGCGTCHQIGQKSVTLTKIGMQAGDLLHKGCLDMCCPGSGPGQAR